MEYATNLAKSKLGSAIYTYADNVFTYTYNGEIVFEITKDEIEQYGAIDSAELILPEHYLDAGYKIYIDAMRKEDLYW